MKWIITLLLVALPFCGAFADDDTAVDAAAISQQIIGVRAGLSAASETVSALQASVNAASTDDSGADLSSISQMLADIKDVLASIHSYTSTLYSISDILARIEAFSGVIANFLLDNLVGVGEKINNLNSVLSSFQDSVNLQFDTWGSDISLKVSMVSDIYYKADDIYTEMQYLSSYLSNIESILSEILTRMDGTFTVDYLDGGRAADIGYSIKSSMGDVLKALANLQVSINSYGSVWVEDGDISAKLASMSGNTDKISEQIKNWHSHWSTDFLYSWQNYFMAGMPTIFDFYQRWLTLSTEDGSFMPVVRLGYDSSDLEGLKLQYLDYSQYVPNGTAYTETNIADMVDLEIDSGSDFFQACTKLLVASVKVASANGKTAYDILSVLRSDKIPGVDEEDKPDLGADLTKMENDYNDGDGWRDRFMGITNTLNEIQSDVNAESSVNSVFGGLSPSAPSSISFKFPEYDWTFGGFDIHTQSETITAQIDGNTSQFFENCRAVAVFAWWVLAVLVHYFFFWLFIRLFKSNVVDRLDNILAGH